MTKKEIKARFKEIRGKLRNEYKEYKKGDSREDDLEFAEQLDTFGCDLIQLGKDIKEEEKKEEEGEEKVEVEE